MRSILVLGAALVALAYGPAQAAPGDIYRCVVSDFRYGGPGHPPDPSFDSGNRQKTFDIFELEDRLSVSMNSSVFTPSTTEYLIVGRGLLETVGIEQNYLLGLSSIVVSQAPAARSDGRIEATLVRQGSQYVNTWYLDCIYSK